MSAKAYWSDPTVIKELAVAVPSTVASVIALSVLMLVKNNILRAIIGIILAAIAVYILVTTVGAIVRISMNSNMTLIEKIWMNAAQPFMFGGQIVTMRHINRWGMPTINNDQA